MAKMIDVSLAQRFKITNQKIKLIFNNENIQK